MSSINTNLGAMVALDTLKGINKNLGMVQQEISTGKSINSAADNAAIWSISTVMESDVAGFEQISNSLNLGSATVGVARTAAEDVVSSLQDIRDNIIAAQENNVDRSKIQADIDEAVSQISSTVSGAQFNGANLLNESGSISILSSLDRSSDGSVTAANITVNKVDLTTNTGVTGGAAVTGAATFTAAQDASSSDLTNSTAIQVDAAGSNQTYAFTIDGEALTYETSAGQTAEQIATGIAGVINDAVTAGDITAGLTATATAGGAVQFTTTGTPADYSLSATGVTYTATVTDGGLLGLESIDVTSDAGASSALTAIEGFLTTAIDAAAAFGSKQGRIESQIDFVSSLSDSLTAGISTLVDANLEEASARLQALQVQQQLGVQALSIANQAPQALLSLFR